jgi:hypothetical protein
MTVQQQAEPRDIEYLHAKLRSLQLPFDEWQEWLSREFVILWTVLFLRAAANPNPFGSTWENRFCSSILSSEMCFGYSWKQRTVFNITYYEQFTAWKIISFRKEFITDLLPCKRKIWVHYPIGHRRLLFLYDCLKICKVFFRKYLWKCYLHTAGLIDIQKFYTIVIKGSDYTYNFLKTSQQTVGTAAFTSLF